MSCFYTSYIPSSFNECPLFKIETHYCPQVKDWGESVSELMIVKNSYNKLNTVLSGLGVCTFCTCCIVICIVCIVASFKLSCV